MLVLMVAAVTGTLATLAVLWSYGAFIALVGAPFGGCLLILLTCLLMALLRSRAEQRQERRIQAPQSDMKAAA